VTWADQDQSLQEFKTYLRILTQDKPGILAHVTLAISACGANIHKAQATISEDMLGVLDFELTLKNLIQLMKVIAKIESNPDVVSVERIHSNPLELKTLRLKKKK
jgi:GTP pyrophosphokinase